MTTRRKRISLRLFCGFSSLYVTVSIELHFAGSVGGGSQQQILNPKIPVIFLDSHLCIFQELEPSFWIFYSTPAAHFQGLAGLVAVSLHPAGKSPFPPPPSSPPPWTQWFSCRKIMPSGLLSQHPQVLVCFQQLLPLTYQNSPARYCSEDYSRILAVLVWTYHCCLPSILQMRVKKFVPSFEVIQKTLQEPKQCTGSFNFSAPPVLGSSAFCVTF